MRSPRGRPAPVEPECAPEGKEPSVRPYRAPWWLPGAHAQTLYASLLGPRLRYRRERWTTPDGDFVDVDRVDGAPDAPLVVLFHGLEGGSRSHYARALMHRIGARGWRGAVPHFRGCSGEANLLARAYHSGDADEIGWMLERFQREAAGAGLFAAGVSLGGNALLKWLGEQGERAHLAGAAAACAPLDLMAAGEALGQGIGLLYAKMFLATLRKKSLAKLARYPGIYKAAAVKRAATLREFDNAVTAPLHGFRDTDDYWTRASAKPWLARIAVPTLLIHARDDPFLPERALPRPGEVSGSVECEFPQHGGHVGFVSGAFPGNIDWLPARIISFFESKT